MDMNELEDRLNTIERKLDDMKAGIESATAAALVAAFCAEKQDRPDEKDMYIWQAVLDRMQHEAVKIVKNGFEIPDEIMP